jgi:hypothetical protein
LFIAVAGVITIIVLKVVNPNKSKVVATVNNASGAFNNATGADVSSVAVQLLIAMLHDWTAALTECHAAWHMLSFTVRTKPLWASPACGATGLPSHFVLNSMWSFVVGDQFKTPDKQVKSSASDQASVAAYMSTVTRR